jgi:guanylate kinase
MRYLFILGMSGSGKTTLAKHLEEWYPLYFKKIVQCTTRPKREGELEGIDYYFLNEAQYNKMDKMNFLIGQVREEFSPYKYGTPYSDLKEEIVNVIVLSIEGFLDAYYKLKDRDQASVIFIRDVQPEAIRENRDHFSEEKYNSIVLHTLGRLKGDLNLVEISHSDLKEIRDDKEQVFSYMKDRKIL